MDRLKGKLKKSLRSSHGKAKTIQPDQAPNPLNATSGSEPSSENVNTESIGNHGLFTLFDPATPLVDVVAIHGLNGHYLKTWTAGTSNWLRDFLPLDLPAARIMSLGYDSRVAFSSSVGHVHRFADQLLACLNRERKERETQDRPIIFICHSMGGLVMKQALIRAHEDPHYEHILRQVSGVAFMATPHRGSKNWGSIGALSANLLKSLTLGFTTNDQLVKDLKDGSPKLEQIARSFIFRAEQLNIVSFYELKCLGSMPWPVVPEDSATLGIPEEIRVPIDADHRTICRFESRSEQKYLTVISQIRDLVSTAVKTAAVERKEQENALILSLSREDEKYLEMLYTSNYNMHRNRVARPVAGTCTWILKHGRYHAWVTSSISTLLWLSADPGCGKTVLSSYLISVLAESETVCFFFLKQDNPEQNNITAAISAILHQLMCKKPFLLNHVKNACRYRGSKALSQFNILWDILVEVALDERAGTIICVVDGIDECPEQERSDLLACLREFISSSDAEKSCLKFIINGRPYVSIERDFSQIPGVEQIRLRAEEEPIHVLRDINALVTFRVKELAHLKTLNQQIQNELAYHLTQHAGTNFLWVTLVLDMIEQSPRVSKRVLDKFLASTPDKLDEMYEQILSKSPDPGEAKRVLQIVAGAFRPLTLDEINIALNITDEDTSMADIDLEPSIKNTIRDLCGLFLHIANNTVYFVHHTAFDFIVDPKSWETNVVTSDQQAASTSVWKHCVELKAADELLANICMQILRLQDWQEITPLNADDIERSSDSSSVSSLWERVLRLRSPPPHVDISSLLPGDGADYLLTYSAQHWFNHFERAGLAEQQESVQNAIALCEPSQPWFRVWSLFYDRDSLFHSWRVGSIGNYVPSAVAVMTWLRLDSLLAAFLRTWRPDLTTLIPFNGYTALHCAIGKGDEATALVLINAGAPWDVQGIHGDSPLHYACSKRLEAVVRLLLEKGAQPDSRNDHKQTPLHRAVSSYRELDTDGHFPIINMLLEAGASLHALDSFGFPPLFWAVRDGSYNITKLLLDYGAQLEVFAYDRPIRNALNMVPLTEDEGLIELLLSYKPDVINAVDYDGYTPLFRYYTACNPNFLVLLKLGADPRITPTEMWPISLLTITEVSGSTENAWDMPEARSIFADMIDKIKVPAENKGLEQAREMMSIVSKQESETGFRLRKELLIRALIQVGVDVNAGGLTGYTPLIASVGQGDLRLVEILLCAGAEVNALGDSRGSALIGAVSLGYNDIMKRLLDYGADPNQIGGVNGSPLIVAVKRNNEDTVRLLIYHGADVDLNAGEPHGTPLLVAARNNLAGMALILLANGADPNKPAVFEDGRVFWPYSVAEDNGSQEVMQLLMWNGANVDPLADFEFKNDFANDAIVEAVGEDDKQDEEPIPEVQLLVEWVSD